MNFNLLTSLFTVFLCFYCFLQSISLALLALSSPSHYSHIIAVLAVSCFQFRSLLRMPTLDDNSKIVIYLHRLLPSTIHFWCIHPLG